MGCSSSNEAMVTMQVEDKRLQGHLKIEKTLTNWNRSFPAITLEELQNKRVEFWETRVEGDVNSWLALRLCSETDDSTSFAIMESAGLTPFDTDGDECIFCYDSTGKRYDIPFWVLHQPANLVTVPKILVSSSPSKQEGLGTVSTIWKINCRLSSGIDVLVQIRDNASIAELKNHIFKSNNITLERQQVYS